jgi:signal transduction histidine kinase
VCFVLATKSTLGGIAYSPLFVSSSDNPDGYPVLTGFRPWHDREGSALQVGDRLVSLEDSDLRGLGPIGFFARVSEVAASKSEVSVLYERGGERATTQLVMSSFAVFWPALALSLVCALTALIGFLRAPPSPMIRAWFAALMLVAIETGSGFAGSEWEARLSLVAHLSADGLMGPMVAAFVMMFPDGKQPARVWVRRLAWLFAVLGLFEASRIYGYPLPPGVGERGFYVVLLLGYAVGFVMITAKYRSADPIGRRRVRWVMLGVYCALVPSAAALVMATVDPRFTPLYLMSLIAWICCPLSFLVAMEWYNLFDIDRLISAATSYTIVLVVLVAAGLLLAPRLADVAPAVVGLDPLISQIIFALFFAALIVPFRRQVSPLIERVFFRERYTLARGVESLLSELSRCATPEELVLRTGEQLTALVAPESCVIYARSGQAFAPIFVRAPAIPQELRAQGSLAVALQPHEHPVEVERWLRIEGPVRLEEAERQTLEELRVRLLLPVHRRGNLSSFVCLGNKRSGDIYTATDLALLIAVVNKVSTELARFDEATLASIGEEMARMMHDLRNPLAIASGYTEMLSSVQTDRERADLTKKIKKQFELMERMAGDVLAYSRGETKTLVKEVHVDRFLSELQAQLEPELTRRGVRLLLDPGFEGTAYFDEVKLLRAIHNLARNAVEAMPEGGTFRVSTTRNGDRIVWTFSDTGQGIRADVKDRLFSPFATSGKLGGSGLGLVTVKRVVEDLDGRIQVESSSGRGTTFTIVLPVTPPKKNQGSS